MSDAGLVELGQVEHALSELRGSDHAGSVRATTLNLVVWCDDGNAVERAGTALEAIGGSRPLRAIVLQSGEGRPLASVASSCWDGGGREVCSERVVIRGEPAALPSAVAYLLVPDLPVFVWWQGTIEEGDVVLHGLAAMATRLVLDSDDAGIEAVDRMRSHAPGLLDLAWVRTAGWREAVAGLFDGRAQRRALDHLVAVEVRGPRNEARLLAGWLRSRTGRQVGLDHRAATRLRRIELDCGDDLFVVEREPRGAHGVAGGSGIPDHPVPLPMQTISQVLSAELDRLGADRVFEEALAAAAA